MTERIRFSIKEFKDFLILEFVITTPSGTIDPIDLKEIVLPKMPLNTGIAISGRGPVWLYCNLAHMLHPARWVGTFEPRSNSIIVVSSHVNKPTAGDVISL